MLKATEETVTCKNDSSNRMRGALGKLPGLTEDEKFITSRQTIQNVWKVAATGFSHQKKVVDHLAGLFERCGRQKHGTPLRPDIIQSLRKLFDERGGASVQETALRLIGTESDARCQKKLAAYWKGI